MEPQASAPDPQNPTQPQAVPEAPVNAVPQQPSQITQTEPVAVQAPESPAPVAVVSGSFVPLAAAPQQQYVSASQLAKTSKSPAKKLLFVILSLLVLGGLAGGGALYYMSQNPSPQKVFAGFIDTTLQTKSVTQKASSKEANGTLMLDVSDVKQPRVSFTADIAMSGIKFGVDGYGSLQNDYIKFNKISIDNADTSKIPVINKWVQLRKQSNLDSAVDISLVQLMDPRYAVLGENIIFGNFSATDRAALTASAKQKPFLKYDASNVKKDTLDGHKVFVYEITVDKNALADYNKKIAKIMGISDADVADSLQKHQDESSSFTLFIRTDNKQVTKLVRKDSSGSTNMSLYTDYNKTSLPAEPKGEITYDQFQQGVVQGLGQ